MRPDQWLIDAYKAECDAMHAKNVALKNRIVTLTDALEITTMERDAWKKEAIALKREATRHEV